MALSRPRSRARIQWGPRREFSIDSALVNQRAVVAEINRVCFMRRWKRLGTIVPEQVVCTSSSGMRRATIFKRKILVLLYYGTISTFVLYTPPNSSSNSSVSYYPRATRLHRQLTLLYQSRSDLSNVRLHESNLQRKKSEKTYYLPARSFPYHDCTGMYHSSFRFGKSRNIKSGGKHNFVSVTNKI